MWKVPVLRAKSNFEDCRAANMDSGICDARFGVNYDDGANRDVDGNAIEREKED